LFQRAGLSRSASIIDATPAISEDTFVGEDDDLHPSAHPTASGVLTRLAYARANAAGMNIQPILRRTTLTIPQIEDPHTRLKVRDQILFLDLVADALKDEVLGFHLAQQPDLREIGWLYYVAASSKTMSEALKRAARFSSLTNEGLALQYENGAVLNMAIRYVGVSRHLDRHQIEFIATIMVRICRQLSNFPVMPTSVRFVHRRSSIPTAFAEFLGSNILFGATSDEVTFPATVKEMPVVSADPYLNKLLIDYCEEALAYRKAGRGPFRSCVENALAPLLPHGRPRAGEIARRLGMSTRTFARRLSAEGLTFSGVLESLRFDLAKRHLTDRDLSISDIAWLLGYQEVSAFTHAFRRWTGHTPRQARARIL
jgi:AraC-like DNA-binding protein